MAIWDWSGRATLGHRMQTLEVTRFAQEHGALFGRIQLIRKVASPGGEHFARLEINEAATIKKLLPITSNKQLDQFFKE